MDVSVEEQINILVEVQGLDTQIYRLREEKDSKPRRLEVLRNACQMREVTLEEQRKKIKSSDVKRKEKEIDLQSKESTIKKYQVQLYQIKTNKEYTSLLTEIEKLKADNSVLEEEILKLFDEIDEVHRDIAREQKLLEEDKKNLKVEEDKVKQELEVIDSALEKLNCSRESLTPKITRSVLDRYERILKGRSGLAAVPVKNDACQGCHMELPPQVINEIKMKGEIIFCENCSRILYVKEDQEAD